MDIFDRIGKTATKAYQFTADKTNKLSKEAKLRINMNNKKSQINTLYKEIGKSVYRKHLDLDLEENDIIEEKIKNIDILSDEIKNISNQLLDLKDIKECKNCYSKILKEYKFCPNCGANQSENEIKNCDVQHYAEDTLEILNDEKENN